MKLFSPHFNSLKRLHLIFGYIPIFHPFESPQSGFFEEKKNRKKNWFNSSLSFYFAFCCYQFRFHCLDNPRRNWQIPHTNLTLKINQTPLSELSELSGGKWTFFSFFLSRVDPFFEFGKVTRWSFLGWLKIFNFLN